MTSKRGMLAVFNGMHDGEIERGHIDLSLKHWLSKGTVAERVGACYTYPQMGGYFQHESGCDPVNFSAAKGGRPSAWDSEAPASGTRQSSDPKQRGKYLIQWREPASQRVWLPLPKDADLILDDYKWKSVSEPTATVKDEGARPKTDAQLWLGDEPEEDASPRSKRSKRGERQYNLRNRKRVWVESFDEASSAQIIINPFGACHIHWGGGHFLKFHVINASDGTIPR